MEDIKIKRCPKCKGKKLIDEFSKDKNRKDGHDPWCKKCKSDYRKKYHQNNLDKENRRSREWKKNNPEKARIGHNEYMKERTENDPIFKLNKNIRNAISRSLKSEKEGKHWEVLVDFTLNELIIYLKSTIPKGYTWDDYLTGKLHIDHKIPISIFNITSAKSKGFKACWALENLRLLPASENIRKKNKLFY